MDLEEQVDGGVHGVWTRGLVAVGGRREKEMRSWIVDNSLLAVGRVVGRKRTTEGSVLKSAEGVNFVEVARHISAAPPLSAGFRMMFLQCRRHRRAESSVGETLKCRGRLKKLNRATTRWRMLTN